MLPERLREAVLELSVQEAARLYEWLSGDTAPGSIILAVMQAHPTIEPGDYTTDALEDEAEREEHF